MPFKPLNLLTVGSATIDIFTTLGDYEVERLTLENANSSFMLLEEGSNCDAISIDDFFGGGAINTAAAARLGLAVDCLIKVGDDIGCGQDNGSHCQRRHFNRLHCPRWQSENRPGRTCRWALRNPTIFSARGPTSPLTGKILKVSGSLAIGNRCISPR